MVREVGDVRKYYWYDGKEEEKDFGSALGRFCLPVGTRDDTEIL